MKRFLTIILLSFSALSQIWAYDFAAYTSSNQILFYTIQSGNNVYVVCPVNSNNSSGNYNGFTRPSGSLAIPSTVTNSGVTYNVIGIGQYAFAGCTGLTSVSMPNTITNMGSYAFSNCTGITSVTISGSITSIPSYAFYNCSSMVGILTYPNPSITSIGQYAFYGCSSLYQPWPSSGSLMPNLTSIGNYAYQNCTGMQHLTLPSTLTSIGYSAFYGCSGLSDTLVIPASLTTITDQAFENCTSLPAVVWNATNCYRSSYGNSRVFYGCTSLHHLEIGSGVQRIAGYLFYGCSAIYNVPTFPSSLTLIGDHAFDGCSMMQGSLDFSNTNLSTIGQYAFSGCTLMSGRPSFPMGVTAISDYAFQNCTHLQGVTFPSTLTSIGYKAFYGCSGLSDTLVIPASLTTITDQAFENCTSLPAVVWNATNCTRSSYGNSRVFYGCTSLHHLEIGSGVQRIAGYLFYGCSAIYNVPTFPSSLTLIGDYAFYGCSMMQGSLDFSNTNLSTIGQYAFYGCTLMSGRPSFPMGVTAISDYAFQNCTHLQGVTFPSTLTSIGFYAFSGCSGLSDTLVIPASLTSLKADAFASCTSLPAVVWNATNCTYTTGTHAPFYGCIALHYIDIGNGVQSLPNWLFSDCTNLYSIRSRATTAPTIGQYTFRYVPTTTPLYVPCESGTSYALANYWILFTNQIQNFPYDVHVYSHDNAMGSASVTQQPTCANNQATIQATANTGYSFDHWNDNNTSNPRTLTVTADVSLTAHFVPGVYTISVNSSNSGWGSVSGGGQYSYNTTATLTATPTTHHHFLRWNDYNTSNPRTVTVLGNATYTAYFATDTHTVTATAADPSHGTVSGSGSYEYGSTATITATAATGYDFNRWSDNITQNPRTVTVNSDINLTAYFTPHTYTITANSSNNSWGSVSGGGQYSYNTTATLTATPTTHHHFLRWNDNNTANPRTVTVLGDATYTAHFVPDTHTITAVSADTIMGTVSGSGQYAYGGSATLTATASTGHSFSHWGGGNTQNPRTVTVTGNATYTAYFSLNNYTVSVVSGNSEWGSVSGGGTFPYGSEIQIEASAVEGYHFTSWGDGNRDNPRTVMVLCDAVYTAYFAEDVQCTVTVLSSDETRGYVTGGGIYISGQQATFSATAYEHYRFSHWSDDNMQNPRTVTVFDNVTYTAYFNGVEHNITVYSSDDNMGSVSGGGTYEYGSQVTLTATPNNGYHFVNWSNGSEENPYTFTVFGDVALIAQFARNIGIGDVDGNKYVLHVTGRELRVGNAERQALLICDIVGRTIYATDNYDGRKVVLPTSGVYLLCIGKNTLQRILVH